MSDNNPNATDSSASRASRFAAKAKKKPRSLLVDAEPEKQIDAAADEVPFVVGLTTASPVLSIGFELEQGEIIFPWASLITIQRRDNQALILIGDWQFTLIYDQSRAELASWSFLELIDALMDQSVRWLRHRPESGLTLRGEEAPKDE